MNNEKIPQIYKDIEKANKWSAGRRENKEASDTIVGASLMVSQLASMTAMQEEQLASVDRNLGRIADALETLAGCVRTNKIGQDYYYIVGDVTTWDR